MWADYWFRPASLLNLAVVRIIVVGYQLVHLFNFGVLPRAIERTELPDALYDPLPILDTILSLPGLPYQPSTEFLEVSFWVTIGSGSLALLGLLTNLTLGAFTLGSILLQSYIYSFGDFHHGEALVTLVLGFLALSPCGRVLSVDSILRRWSWPILTRPTEAILDARSAFARWPLVLTRWVFALIYLSGAYSKLRLSGLDWANGFTLQYYLIRDGLRFNIDLGMQIAQYHWLAVALSWFALAFESTFFLVLLFPILGWLYVPLGVGLHLGIYLTMGATFLGYIACYSVFVPWRDVLTRVRQAGRKRRGYRSA